ncbi:MAG: M48 family metallopeptidase [Pelagimonas sp.]|uniref:M48 family metallopeptidase n=1 Tax=Pelagimonas sp. TaxID=2073170 RepID=UPI003D6C1146
MKLISRLNQKFGHSIRDAVLHDMANRTFRGPSRIKTAAKVFAVLILASPALAMGIGGWLMVLGYPNVFAMLVGVVFIAAGFYLFPRRTKNTDTTYGRTDCPTLFSLLDQISSCMEAPKVTGLHVFDEVNAYMARFGKDQHVLGIGAPLWQALTPDQRLAILSHEVAHLINNDPARGELTGHAMMTLSRWSTLFDPPKLIDHGRNEFVVIDDRGAYGQIISNLFGGAVGALTFAYEKLVFSDSQRAEYQADINAALVAGKPAMASALQMSILSPLGRRCPLAGPLQRPRSSVAL